MLICNSDVENVPEDWRKQFIFMILFLSIIVSLLLILNKENNIKQFVEKQHACMETIKRLSFCVMPEQRMTFVLIF